MTRRERLRPVLGWSSLAVAVLLAGLLLAAGAHEDGGSLDPLNSNRPGAQAAATLLRAQGVAVQRVTTTDAAVAAVRTATAGRSTVLVAEAGLLAPAQARRLVETGADLVVLRPPSDVLAAVAPGVAKGELADTEQLEPLCSVPTAQRAGRAQLGGQLYTASTGGTPQAPEVALCYPRGEGAALVQVRSGTATSTVLGASELLTNQHLGESGNAALVLGLLGQRPQLVWFLPSLADVPPGGRRTLRSLVPPWVTFGAVQLTIAALLLALWRARRLGPVVVEPLPVVVRAAETVEGRARLYRRAGARDVAGEALREASRVRLVALLGLTRAVDAGTLVATAAERSGWRPGDVGALLYGAAPGDDAGLVQLAGHLDALEWKVRAP